MSPIFFINFCLEISESDQYKLKCSWNPLFDINHNRNLEMLISTAIIRGGSRILRRRGRQLFREGVPTYYFPKFSKKLHEIEKILDGGGGRRERPP